MSTITEMLDGTQHILNGKMQPLEVAEVATQANAITFCDGNDSGVDIATTRNVSLQRALSNNSGDCGISSYGVLDESTMCLNNSVSCDSSMISFSSDLCEFKAAITVNNVLAYNHNHGYGHGSHEMHGHGHSNLNYECYSENGSESSSVAGCSSAIMAGNRKITNSIKKKVDIFETQGVPTPRASHGKEPTVTSTSTLTAGQSTVTNSRIRPKLAGICRTSSLPRNSLTPPVLQARERARSREKSIALSSTVKPTSTFRCAQVRVKPQKPDTLPTALTTHSTLSLQRMVQRTPSLSRARTPVTPSDDGRWPSVGGRGSLANAKRGFSATPDLASLKIRSSKLSMDAKSHEAVSISPYGTLPRRRKQKSVEDLTGRSSRSSSTSHDPSSNLRMTSSVVNSTRRTLANSFGLGNMAPKMLPPASVRHEIGSRVRKPALSKTRIYHEVSAQTAITHLDLEKITSGAAPLLVSVDAVEFHDAQSQTDLRDKELEQLRDEIYRMEVRENEMTKKLNDRAKRIAQLELVLRKEHEEKIAIQSELHLNTDRVMGMLELVRLSGTPTDDDGQCDSLLMLESQIQMSGQELHEKQEEIGKLRKLCRTLEVEMERSRLAQDNLLQEKVAIEQESSELHDFLQHEKAAMCDALKDMEQEYQACKHQLENKSDEIKVLRDECRHLVRLNEQRRQENRLIQAKYATIESKSREFIGQQNASVSSASLSLSTLHTRLDSLVEQLISSFCISEQDLEDIGFQQETMAKSNSGYHDVNVDNNDSMAVVTNNQTDDGSLSPQRNQSFIAAVISAIRNATTPSGKKLLARHKKLQPETITTANEESDSTTEMLDSETEPCLMMDNVLEDVTMPDSHSHNLVSTSCAGIISQMDITPSELMNTIGDESLQNLSQAIVNRQQVESQINSLTVNKLSIQLCNQYDNSLTEDVSYHDSVAEIPSLVDYCSAQAVVDQVIAVDHIVTKLLKVLRLIQMDNDNCIQQLIMDKNKLQQNKEDNLEKLKDLQDVNIKLQDELMDATQELMLKNNDLSNAKADIQRHRNEIDRFTQDVCNLSTVCSGYRKFSPSLDQSSSTDGQLDPLTTTALPLNTTIHCDILQLLCLWQQKGHLEQTDIHDFLYAALCHNMKANKEECNANDVACNSNSQLEEVLRTLCDVQMLDGRYKALQALHERFQGGQEELGGITTTINLSIATDETANDYDSLNANDE